MRSLTLVLATALTLVATAGDVAREVPADFQPLDAALKLDGRPADFMLPDTIDLSWGVSMISCPSGAWRGKVRFVGHAGGDIEYDGDMYGCFTFGKGTARYADGTSYSGSVNAYVAAGLDSFTRLSPDGVRMAVPEGVGTALRLGVAAQQQAFVRGALSLDPRDPRFSALDVALVGLGREAAAGAAWIVQNGANAGAVVEKGVANVERGAAKTEREMQVAAGQAVALGAVVVKQGLAVSSDAEAFAKRAGQEAKGVEPVIASVGKELGNVGGFVQKNSNSSPNKTDIGGKLFGASKSAARPAASAPAVCLVGHWRRATCGGTGTVELHFVGGAQGTGSRVEASCSAGCPQGRRDEFRYSLGVDGALELEYTASVSCGLPEAPPASSRLPATCAGASLELDGAFKRMQP